MQSESGGSDPFTMDSFFEVGQPRGSLEQSAGAAQCSQRRWFKVRLPPLAVAQFDTRQELREK
jgi:hypothetical protein